MLGGLLPLFIMPGLSSPMAIIVVTGWLLFYVAALPRLVAGLQRQSEGDTGIPIGLVLQPTAALLLITIFWTFGATPHVAAAAWTLHAFGDAAAHGVGRRVGPRMALPWNPQKTWAGMVAYGVVGAIVAGLVSISVVARMSLDVAGGEPVIWSAVVGTAALCALLESLPVRRLADNLWVPLAAAVVLYASYLLHAQHMVANLPPLPSLAWSWASVVLGLGVGLRLGFWTLGGSFAVAVLGALVALMAGFSGVLSAGTAAWLGWWACHFSHRRRLSLGLTHESSADRWTGVQMIANAATGLFLAFLAYGTDVPHGGLHDLFRSASLAAMAGSLAGVLSRELGPVYGRTPVLATTLQRVVVGTAGAISFEGSLIGAAGALGLSVAGAAFGYVPWPSIIVIAIAGSMGSYLESFVAASLVSERRPNHDTLNFLNTLAAGLGAILMQMLVF